MVAIVDSDDDDDFSSNINSVQRRKHNSTKVSKNKIEDSDDGEKSPAKSNKINDGDGLVIDISSKGGLTVNNDNSNDEESMLNNNSMLEDEYSINGKIIDSGIQNNVDNDNDEGSINTKQKKKGRLKSNLCFSDSSDEEIIGKDKFPEGNERSKTKSMNSSTEDGDDDTNSINEIRFINDDIENANTEIDKNRSDDDIVENLLKDRDLYDADSASDTEHTNTKEESDTRNSEDELLEDKKHSKKEKRPSKDALKEAKSEQQRLLRQQKFRLPYHVPEVKPLKEFLLRVPVLKTSERKRKQQSIDIETSVVDVDECMEIEVDSKNDNSYTKNPVPDEIKSNIGNLFKQKPKLSLGNEGTIEFEETFGNSNVKKEVRKKECVLDSFMKRFEKHTKGNNRKDLSNKDADRDGPSIPHVVIPENEKIPGGRRIAFAEQMKLKIRKERAKVLKEHEQEKKLLNEEDFSEEEGEFDGDGDDEDDDDDDDDGGEYVEDGVDKTGTQDLEVEDAGNDAGSSDDEELEKWNLDDKHKALELELEAEEKRKTNNANSIDFTIEEQKTPNTEQRENDDLRWDDSCSTISSVLPAGQGDPTERKNSVDGRMTPFSKLIKSGLLDSSSNLNYNNNSCSQGPIGGITLPCEDTQDLYKENPNNEEESQMVLNSFELKLEETQYTQVIDSQGFFSESKKSKRQLFDEDTKNSGSGFSQVIGLCSGKFDDEGTETITKSKGNMDGIFNKDNELSMSQVIGLCSGKFIGDEGNDDDPVTSTGIAPTCKTVLCDEESCSNPPTEHPFSSRITSNVKPLDTSQMSPTSENIFALDTLETKPPKEDKPLGLSNIIDDNFDDNAIDFCTAPFSGQVADNDSEEDVRKLSKKKTGVSSQTKFDVGNWLNKDTKLSGKDSGSDGSAQEDDKKVEKIVIHNEDDVFSANDNKDNHKKNENYADDTDDDGSADENRKSEVDNEESVDESEEEEGTQVEEYNGEGVNEELLEYQNAISIEKKKKKKWSKSAFTEKEAELSGSDINSDDEDLGSEYDEYEIDSDVENLPSGEKLKSQIHKIHQKKLLDQDQREVRLLQELYIEDADRAYGKKRQRNFRWRNIADDETFNLSGHSGDEEDELNLDNNISQKLERAEREKYISELQETQKVSLDENSQSMLEMIKGHATSIAEKPLPILKPRLSSKSGDGRVSSQKRSGSFLSQARSSITNLSLVKKASAQGGKSFVFQVTEDENKMSAGKENKAVTSKASTSEPARKRTKFNPHIEASESQSIFDLL